MQNSAILIIQHIIQVVEKSNGTNQKWQCTNKYFHSCWMENRTWKPCTYLFCWGRREYHIPWLALYWKYLIQYHIIRYSKFIFLVLKGSVEEILKQILQKIYYHIKALEVKPDHIHVFVDVPQTAASCDVARTFKDISAIELFKAFPQLIQFYRMRYFMV